MVIFIRKLLFITCNISRQIDGTMHNNTFWQTSVLFAYHQIGESWSKGVTDEESQATFLPTVIIFFSGIWWKTEEQ